MHIFKILQCNIDLYQSFFKNAKYPSAPDKAGLRLSNCLFYTGDPDMMLKLTKYNFTIKTVQDHYDGN